MTGKIQYWTGVELESNPDLCVISPVLNQLIYQANWELVIMWVNDKQIVDVCGQINEIWFEQRMFPCYHE